MKTSNLSTNLGGLNYDSFGMVMPTRSFEAGSGYRYGFNGQEKLTEIYGTGNMNIAEYWHYDTRIGKRWNLDPKGIVSNSPYTCFANNPLIYTDMNGDTTAYYNMETNELLGTINDASRYNRIKIDKEVWDGQQAHVEYFGLDITTQNWANWYVKTTNSIGDIAELTDGEEHISRQNDMRFTFTGTAELSSNILNCTDCTEYYSNGFFTVYALFDDDTEISVNSLAARSGPWGNGPGPNGGHVGTSINGGIYTGMVSSGGVGFKVIISPAANGRDAMWIHPDGGNWAGTAGCTGLTCTDAELLHFEIYTKAFFVNYPNQTISYNINITNNPNYGPNESAERAKRLKNAQKQKVTE